MTISIKHGQKGLFENWIDYEDVFCSSSGEYGWEGFFKADRESEHDLSPQELLNEIILSRTGSLKVLPQLQAYIDQQEKKWKIANRIIDSVNLRYSVSRSSCIAGPSQRAAEDRFASIYGRPLAIINNSNDSHLIRTEDGQYWEGRSVQDGYQFLPVDPEQGRKLEDSLASDLFEERKAEFFKAPQNQRLAMKTTGRFAGHNGLSGLSSLQLGDNIDEILSSLFTDKQFSLHFAGVEYVTNGSQSTIAYDPNGPVARYYLEQIQNGCVAAAILNGGIFSGKIKKDPKLLKDFSNKLVSIQNSSDGRIDVEELAFSIEEGKIPGLSIQIVENDEIEEFLASKKPLIRLSQAFSGHAVLVTQFDLAERTFKTIDTVTGMEVPRPFYNAPILSTVISVEITDKEQFLDWVRLE